MKNAHYHQRITRRQTLRPFFLLVGTPPQAANLRAELILKDGGGVKSYASLLILKTLMQLISEELAKECSICKLQFLDLDSSFSLACSTSDDCSKAM
jgi:hypothetical protein